MCKNLESIDSNFATEPIYKYIFLNLNVLEKNLLLN